MSASIRGRLEILVVVALLAQTRSDSAQIVYDAADPNLVAMPYPRVRLVHAMNPAQRGATAHLRGEDPFLLYQLGRDLVLREFTPAEGVYGREGELSVPLYVDEPLADARDSHARFARDHAASCAACHSIPAREPGGGQTIASTGGMGRNSPHFFGAGLVEMIAEQTRQIILNTYDTNHNGVIDRAELRPTMPVRIRPADGAPPIDYGDLAPGPDGVPRLNPVFRVWFVDDALGVLADARELGDPRVAGFDFALQPFGWGRGWHTEAGGRSTQQGAESSTLRGIYALAADVHMGMQAFDPSQMGLRPDRTHPEARIGGIGGRSLNGARQFDFFEAPDRGRRRTAAGISLDDPDRDGHVTELSEGDLDAAEFYMLHAPPPAALRTRESLRGRAVLRSIGCVRCHVERWTLRGRDDSAGFTGDRRLFRLQPETTFAASGPEVRLRLLWQSHAQNDGRREPDGRGFVIEGLYSDLKHWDIGPAFHERRFDGTLQREHRTAPLWGVGSTAPYGHAGQFGSLDEVIRAHSGAARVEATRYGHLSAADRGALLKGLESLVLFQVDAVPADVNGDGRFSMHYRVGGTDVGYERFDARFLFKTPPRFRSLYPAVDAAGRPRPLAILDNALEAYGLGLPWRRDSVGDGFPDLVRPPATVTPSGAGRDF